MLNLKPILVISLATIVLLGCSQPKQLIPLSEEDTIVAFGDDLTLGHGVEPDKSYPSIVKKITGLNVINAGVKDETTSQGVFRFKNVLDKHSPAMVLLMQGGSDIKAGLPQTEIYNNLKEMVQEAQNRNIEVVLVACPGRKAYSGTLGVYSKLADEFDLPLEGDAVAELMLHPSMKSDYLHLNEKGYEKLAISVVELLRDNGAL